MAFLLKKLFGSKTAEDTANSEILKFTISGSLYRRERKQSSLLLEKTQLKFSVGEGEFLYYLECSGDAKEESFYFPITTKMDLREQTVNDGDTVLSKYVFDLEQDLQMRIEFDITEKQTAKKVKKFEEIMSQLICQHSLQRKVTVQDALRVEQACRHIVPQEKKSDRNASSNSTSDGFSVKNKHKEESDIDEVTRGLGALKVDENNSSKKKQTIQNVTNHSVTKNDQNSKSNNSVKLPSKEEKEQEKLREDLILDNKNNQTLQDSLLAILKQKDFQVAWIGNFFQEENQDMVLKQKGVIVTVKTNPDSFESKLLVFNSEKYLFKTMIIDNNIDYEVDQDENYLRWIENEETGLKLYQISFDDPGTSKELARIFQQRLFESTNQIAYTKAFSEEEIKEQARYICQKEEYIRDNNDYIEPSNLCDMTFGDARSLQTEAKSNSNLRAIAQAKYLDRTFVSKGDNIEVYMTKNDEDTQTKDLSFLLKLPVVQTLDNQNFEPKKMLFSDLDNKMLLLNNCENKKVFSFDLQKGKVIQEFSADEYESNGIKDICMQGKNEEEQTSTFIAINSKNIFLMDPRIAKGNAQSCVTENAKIYKQDNHFTCVSSTVKGAFAVGSNDGTVRLYSEVGKNAKNSFNLGFGDPIKGLDISKDRKWILATCQAYLILFPAYGQEDKQKNGFNTNIRINDRPAPIRLYLKSQDQYQLNLKKIGFTIAHFDNTQNKERFILTSTGVYTIIWDFVRILQGKSNAYEIKKGDETIQQAEFKYNESDSILAASDSKFKLQSYLKRKNQN